MIDLEKEREAFVESVLNKTLEEFFHGNFQSVGLNNEFIGWQRHAKHAQAEITELKQKLDAKHDAFVYIDECRKEWHESFKNKCNEVEILKQKLARYENPDYVLVPKIPNALVIDSMFNASYHYIVDAEMEDIYKAMIEAVEKGND